MKVFRHVFALLVIASMLLTGCQAATPEAEPEEEIVITFWHQEAVDTRVKILQELLDEFYEETGIMVVQETMTWGEQFVKLMSAIEAGNPPDITWGTEGTAVTLLEAGAIVPMTDIVEEIDGWRKAIAAVRTVNRYHETLLGRLKMMLFQEVDLIDRFHGEPSPTVSGGGKSSREIVNPKFQVLQKIREKIVLTLDNANRR